MEINNLNTKTILITGASRGIGKSLVKALSGFSCKVIAAASNLESFVNYDIKTDNIIFEVFDLNNIDEIDLAVARLKEKKLVPDVLINNAGVGIFKSFGDLTNAEIEKLINVNYKAPILLAKAFLPSMLEKQSGMIVNIISVAAVQSFLRSSVYGATKAALLETMKTIRLEYRKQGIKVLNILPGATNTTIWSPKVREQHGGKMMPPDALAKAIVANINIAFEYDIMPEELTFRPQLGDL